MKFFIFIVLLLSYSSKSNSQQLETYQISEEELTDEQQSAETNRLLSEILNDQINVLSKSETEALIIAQVYNKLDGDPEAFKTSRSLFKGNYKDFERRIDQQSKEKSGVNIGFGIPVVNISLPIEDLKKIILDNPLNIENQLLSFVNEQNYLRRNNSLYESNRERLYIAHDLGQRIHSCYSNSLDIGTCKMDESIRRLIQTFFSDLSPNNVSSSKEGQLFLILKHQKKTEKIFETILDAVGENPGQYSKNIRLLKQTQDKIIEDESKSSRTPHLDALVLPNRDDDPYVSKLNKESNGLLKEIKKLAENNRSIKEALKLEDEGASSSEILESLKQEIDNLENKGEEELKKAYQDDQLEKQKKELEKAYQGFAKKSKLEREKKSYLFQKEISNYQAYLQAGLVTMNVLDKLGVFPEDFPIKEINAFGTVVFQSFEIGRHLMSMSGAFMDPTGITAVMTAVGTIANILIDTGPTFEEAVMETLAQIIDGQMKIIENQQQIMKGIKHLDSRLDRIDEKLDIIIDMLDYSYESLKNNTDRLRKYLQEQESIEKKREKTELILSAMRAYQILSHYEGLFDKSIVKESSLADDNFEDIDSNLVAEALTDSMASLDEMMTFSTIKLFESNITERFDSSVDFTLRKDKNSKSGEWQKHIHSLYEALNRKNLLESLNFLYSKNSNLLNWLNKELRLRDKKAVKEPYKIGQPFYQDEIFSASVLLASSIPSLIDYYDKDDRMDKICLESQKIEQVSKEMRAELPKAWEVYQDYTKQLLSFHFKKNQELRPAMMEKVAADQYRWQEEEEKTASPFEEEVFLFQLPVKPEKQREFLKEYPDLKALFDKKYNHSDDYCDNHYHPELKGLKEECVKVSDLRKELINLLTQLQAGNELERFNFSVDSDETYKKRLDYDLGLFYTNGRSYSESYSAPVLTLTGIDLNHQKYETQMRLSRKWDHIIMALGYWNHINLNCVLGGINRYSGDPIFYCPDKSEIFVPDREAFLKDLKKQFDDFWSQRSYEYLFNESELMANWMKAKLAFESMAYMAYGDSLLFKSELSDLRKLFNIVHSVNRINPQEVSSFFEDLKQIYPFGSNEDRVFQSLVPLESYWLSSLVGLGYPEARTQAIELASQKESLQLNECKRHYKRMRQEP